MWVQRGAAHVACRDRFPFPFSSSSVGALHLTFPVVLWIMRKSIGLTWSFNFFSHSWLELSLVFSSH